MDGVLIPHGLVEDRSFSWGDKGALLDSRMEEELERRVLYRDLIV
jgi:hypothetical protein